MAADFVVTPPDFTVNVFEKLTGRSANIGAAWKKADGFITIKLNPFVVLDTTNKDLTIQLFPPGWKSKKAKPGSTPRGNEATDNDRNEPF